MIVSGLKARLATLKFLWQLFCQDSSVPKNKVVNEHKNQTYDYYPSPNRKKNDIVVFFHGVNQLGNQDPRIFPLVRGLNLIGYDCIIPQLDAYIDIRVPTESDYFKIVDLLNNCIANNARLMFIGASTSCLYMVKIAAHEKLNIKINSMCFISPYFNTENSFKELLISNRSVYGQLVLLKFILHQKSLCETSDRLTADMELLNQAIKFCYEQKYTSNLKQSIVDYISNMSPDNKELIDLVTSSGSTNFIGDKVAPFFQKVIDLSEYKDELAMIKSKITLIHAKNDPIFSPENTTLLANHLIYVNINHQLCITSLLDHADIIKKNIIRESWKLLNIFNHFFTS